MKEKKCYTMEWLKKASDEELLELQKKLLMSMLAMIGEKIKKSLNLRTIN